MGVIPIAAHVEYGYEPNIIVMFITENGEFEYGGDLFCIKVPDRSDRERSLSGILDYVKDTTYRRAVRFFSREDEYIGVRL